MPWRCWLLNLRRCPAAATRAAAGSVVVGGRLPRTWNRPSTLGPATAQVYHHAAALAATFGSAVQGGRLPRTSNRPSSFGGGRAGRGSSRPFLANQSGSSNARSPRKVTNR